MAVSKSAGLGIGDQEDLIFVEEGSEAGEIAAPIGEPWHLLIVDDEPEIHQITKLALRSLNFAQRPLVFTSAFSAQEAREILAKRQDFALAFVDVIMETDEAGLALVRHIREDLRNKKMRLVLRTGQPGMHQERDVMIGYDINDYKTKTELTKERLESSVVASLRTVLHIEAIEGLHERLQMSQKLTAIGEFSMGIVHEIATPLSTLLCVVDLLCEGAESGVVPASAELLDQSSRIQRSGQRIKKLIENLKNFTWSGSDQRRLVEARGVMANVLEMCQYKIRKGNLTVEISVKPENLSLTCTQRQVEQVLINLLNNASDAVQDCDEKKVVVTVSEHGASGQQMIHFEVRDSGPGIPPALQNRIFDSFFTTKPKGQGTGLGLFISKSIADEHGGSFELLRSAGPGATFRLAIPKGH